MILRFDFFSFRKFIRSFDNLYTFSSVLENCIPSYTKSELEKQREAS